VAAYMTNGCFRAEYNSYAAEVIPFGACDIPR